MNSDFNIKKEPIWEFEVVSVIVSRFIEKDKAFMESAEKTGAKKEYMLMDSEKYQEYRNAVLEELMLMLNSQYCILEQFFKSSLMKNSVILDFVLEYIMRDYDDILDEEIDEIMIEILKNISNDFTADSNKNGFEIKNIISIIDMLSKTEIDDKSKMQIINYYNDRYNLSRCVINLLRDGTKILKKHFEIIEDEFNKSVENLENIENFYDICSKDVGLQLPLGGNCDVYTIIFSFNQLSVHALSESYKNYMCLIGMYVFELNDKKRNLKMNDTKIIVNLKALSDATRYKMLFLLSKKNMYLQELSDELGLTPATISHHMNILLQSRIISITMDAEGSRKIYYEINKGKINEVSDSIRELTK